MKVEIEFDLMQENIGYAKQIGKWCNAASMYLINHFLGIKMQ